MWITPLVTVTFTLLSATALVSIRAVALATYCVEADWLRIVCTPESSANKFVPPLTVWPMVGVSPKKTLVAEPPGGE